MEVVPFDCAIHQSSVKPLFGKQPTCIQQASLPVLINKITTGKSTIVNKLYF